MPPAPREPGGGRGRHPGRLPEAPPRRGPGSGSQDPAPWIYRVASNHCLNLRRDVAEHGNHTVGQDLDLLPGRQRDGPDAFPERALAQAVLERFDVETQAVAVAVLVDGMDLEEVAAALGVSTRSVSKKLRRFVAGARQFLIESGEVLPETAARRLEPKLG
jgi:DNA-directed RNA polymerase specialized sigma24 family protein